MRSRQLDSYEYRVRIIQKELLQVYIFILNKRNNNYFIRINIVQKTQTFVPICTAIHTEPGTINLNSHTKYMAETEWSTPDWNFLYVIQNI